MTRAALYKPLAEGDAYTVSEVLLEAEQYIRKVALIFIAGVVVFAAIYPFLTADDFSWLFTFSLILIISLTTFINYYFCYARSVLLEADQKVGIWSIAEISSTVLNTVFAAALIKMGASIHMVKLGSATAFLINPLIIYAYTNRHYRIVRNVQPKENHIVQRWDALAHEIADFINGNIDVITLTVFTNIREVSVYTVYAYVTTSIRKVILDFVSGFNAAFGDMYARKEFDLMNKNLKLYELILFSVTSIVYSTALVMITPFVLLYTAGITDVSYDRNLFGMLLVFANAFTCFRIPYNSIAQAVGHFKQTKKFAYIEACMNIVISVVCVLKWGIVGVTAGTLFAAAFRSTSFAYYLGKHILQRSIWHYVSHVCSSFGIMVITYLAGRHFMVSVSSIPLWIEKAVLITLLASFLTLLVDVIFWRDDLKLLIAKLFSSVRAKKS